MDARRAQLEAERARLKHELARLDELEPTDEPREHGSYVTHVADHASDTFDHERALALRRHVSGVLAQIERALSRLDAGSYGLCESCGRPIQDDRLQALPQATRCLACQSNLEERS